MSFQSLRSKDGICVNSRIYILQRVECLPVLIQKRHLSHLAVGIFLLSISRKIAVIKRIFVGKTFTQISRKNILNVENFRWEKFRKKLQDVTPGAKSQEFIPHSQEFKTGPQKVRDIRVLSLLLFSQIFDSFTSATKSIQISLEAPTSGGYSNYSVVGIIAKKSDGVYERYVFRRGVPSGQSFWVQKSSGIATIFFLSREFCLISLSESFQCLFPSSEEFFESEKCGKMSKFH